MYIYFWFHEKNIMELILDFFFYTRTLMNTERISCLIETRFQLNDSIFLSDFVLILHWMILRKEKNTDSE